MKMGAELTPKMWHIYRRVHQKTSHEPPNWRCWSALESILALIDPPQAHEYKPTRLHSPRATQLKVYEVPLKRQAVLVYQT